MSVTFRPFRLLFSHGPCCLDSFLVLFFLINFLYCFPATFVPTLKIWISSHKEADRRLSLSITFFLCKRTNLKCGVIWKYNVIGRFFFPCFTLSCQEVKAWLVCALYTVFPLPCPSLPSRLSSVFRYLTFLGIPGDKSSIIPFLLLPWG